MIFSITIFLSELLTCWGRGSRENVVFHSIFLWIHSLYSTVKSFWVRERPFLLFWVRAKLPFFENKKICDYKIKWLSLSLCRCRCALCPHFKVQTKVASIYILLTYAHFFNTNLGNRLIIHHSCLPTLQSQYMD
jgi:hypothetical protein